MKHVLFCLCLGIGAALPLSAQDVGGEEPSKVKGRSAWFVYTNMPEGLENPVSVLSGKDLTQVLLSKLSPSDAVKIPADGIVRIVKKIENPDDPKNPAYLTLAQALVPETVVNALVILMPVPKTASGLVFQTKVQDIAALKGGDVMFLNMTNLKVGVELGKAKIEIDPGETKTHNPLGSAKSVSVPIRLSYLNPIQREWAMITASTVALYSTRRELCIFNWDSQFNRVDFESITLPMLE